MTRWNLILLCLLAFGTIPTSVRAADDDGWEVVYYENFNSGRAALESQGWWFENQGGETVESRDGERFLTVWVDPDKSDSGYANFRHPLDQTMQYRVRATLRAQDVQKHPGRRSNRGAVVFVPFADKDNGWIRGGAFPQGLHGTSADWREIVTDPIQIFPSNARYLRIMLGVEGYGRADFRSVTLEQRPSDVKPVLNSPQAEQTVETRFPSFLWQSKLKHADARVELRRSFTPDAPGMDLKASGVTELHPDEPLSSGEWFWRVHERLPAVDSWHTSDWQRFHVAEGIVDKKIRFQPNWIREFKAPDKLRLRITGVQDTDNIEAQVNGATASLEPREDEWYALTAEALQTQGVHEIRVQISGDRSEPAVFEDFYVNKRSGSDVKVTKEGWLKVDGEPFFPIGAFRDPSDSLDRFDGIKEAGFNLTHDYAMEHGSVDLPRIQRYLRDADRAGLKAFIGLRRSDVHENNEESVRQWAATLKDEPALLSWYLYDEPAVNETGAYRLENLGRLIKAIAPDQPTSLVLSRPMLTGAYADATDLMWVDPYPVPSRPLVMVEQWVKQARSLAKPGQPVWAVLGVHDLRYWENPKEALAKLGNPTRPTYEETRCMTHLALAAGAQGLIYYWGPTTRYHLRDDAPEVWSGLCRVIGELRELEPLLEAGPQAGVPCVPQPLRSWSSRAGDQHVVVLVNPHPEPTSVAIAKLCSALPSGSTIKPNDGQNYRFEPYEVLILRNHAAAP